MKPLVQYLKKFTGPLGADQVSDGALLEQFVRRQDSAAFAVLMQRHGPMVLNVCRKLLRDANDVDDAYQAVFLVLVRRAGGLEKRPYLGGWLYQVAQRTGLKARALAARRQQRQQPLDDQQAGTEVVSMHDADTHSVLNEELGRLPEKYRAPLVFCYLQGKSTEEAAQRLGCPRGTILWRLSRGRDLLRVRLNRRGVALAATAVAAALSEQVATAAVPATLAEKTAHACLTLAAGKPLADAAVSTAAQTLAREVNRGLVAAHYKLVAGVAVCVSLLLGGIGWLAWNRLAALAVADTEPVPVALPADPRSAVVSLDLRAADAPAGAQPLLAIHADGTALSPAGDDLLQTKLTPEELQTLLTFVVRRQDFFAHDSGKLEAELRAAAARKGLVHGFPNSSVTVLHVQADGREHEVRLAALGDGLVRQYPEVRSVAQLNDIQRRLMQVVHLIRAGGKSGVSRALEHANRELGQAIPDAPALTADDLHEARRDGNATEIVFERRGLGAARDPFTFVHARVHLEGANRPEVSVWASLGDGEQIGTMGASKLDRPLDVTPKPIAGDKAVKYDYDIVYVRSPRPGDDKLTAWAEAFSPARMQAGSDLVLLHPDGAEEVLVEARDGAVADPYVSFDGAWVFYALFHDMKTKTQGGLSPAGADIYKIHVPTRKIVRLTHQERTPNTGVVGADGLKNMGVFNLGPCPLPGGRLMFTSNRNGFVPPKEYTRPTLQLFTMDDDGSNVEMIGHLNIGSALHPTILRDGRVMFSSYESQGVRDLRQWGIWTIHPDGANWAPLVSAFRGEFLFHFQSQLSSGDIVVEEYYNLNNQGFGTYYKLPETPGTGNAPFGPGYRQSNPLLPNLHDGRMPFTPTGMKSLTPFVSAFDSPAPRSNRADPQSPRVGKFTHPSGAPDNHLLTVWSPGSVNINGSHQASWFPAVDSGIYVIKSGQTLEEPGAMLLIKNDPRYNEQWPRALVPYRRIYGVEQPALPAPLANDGTLSPHLPAGSPFGLVGTSSLYKRESFPDGLVREGKVAAEFAGNNDPYEGLESFNGYPKRTPNWLKQGADAGKYGNSDIHAVRILAMEPTTTGRKRFWNYASERLRILGELPVRKFAGETQPVDPDGNPDTSFLAKIPADVAWTFQTLDKNGMVLNMSQTWHQVRPGEVRHDCGGCHAHSQQPTPFEKTAAARNDYQIFDLTTQTPLLTTRGHDQSKAKWDEKNETGLRFEKGGAKNVEYYRDVRPILRRSCAACHSKDADKPAGNLVLDDDALVDVPHGHGGMLSGPAGKVPGTFARLAFDTEGRFAPSLRKGWAIPQVSRYVRMFQSRRSLLAWKLLGQRTDGWSNDDFPTETVSGDAKTLQWKGKPVEASGKNLEIADVDYLGSIMPPAEAVKSGKVQPLTDDDRLTLIRWIDLGCPIDLDYDLSKPDVVPNGGWLTDEVRPALTVAAPRAGRNAPLNRILIGMHDAYTGLDFASFSVSADFAVNGMAAGTELSKNFRSVAPGVWELQLEKPLANLPAAKLTVSVKDRQGNVTRLERMFSIP